jgi:hypothetical protein
VVCEFQKKSLTSQEPQVNGEIISGEDDVEKGEKLPRFLESLF